MKRLLSLLIAAVSLACAQYYPNAGGPGGTVGYGSGTTDPATCTPNVTLDFFNTTSQAWKYCSASNTWTAGRSVVGNQVVGTTVLRADGRITAGGVIMGGVNNLFVGVNSGHVCNNCNNNTSIGVDALDFITTGLSDTGLGYDALWSMTTGAGNTGVGAQTGFNSTIDTYSTYIGSEAGKGVATYSRDHATFVGAQSGYSVTSGGGDSFLGGYQAGFSLTTGVQDVCVGSKTCGTLTTGSRNIIIGYNIASPSVSTSDYMQIGPTFSGDMANATYQFGTSTTRGQTKNYGTAPAFEMQLFGGYTDKSRFIWTSPTDGTNTEDDLVLSGLTDAGSLVRTVIKFHFSGSVTIPGLACAAGQHSTITVDDAGNLTKTGCS